MDNTKITTSSDFLALFFFAASIYKYSGFATRIQMIAATTIITISSIHGSKRNYNYFNAAVADVFFF